MRLQADDVSGELRRWLVRTWWLLFPLFAVLTVRLTLERACGNPYDLLPLLTSTPGFAWPIAGVYVLGHAWIAAAYVLTVSETGLLIPDVSAVYGVWQRNGIKLAVFCSVLVVEYAPITIWRSVGRWLCAS